MKKFLGANLKNLALDDAETLTPYIISLLEFSKVPTLHDASPRGSP